MVDKDSRGKAITSHETMCVGEHGCNHCDNVTYIPMWGEEPKCLVCRGYQVTGHTEDGVTDSGQVRTWVYYQRPVCDHCGEQKCEAEGLCRCNHMGDDPNREDLDMSAVHVCPVCDQDRQWCICHS